VEMATRNAGLFEVNFKIFLVCLHLFVPGPIT
jgi:hypothetical protein